MTCARILCLHSREMCRHRALIDKQKKCRIERDDLSQSDYGQQLHMMINYTQLCSCGVEHWSSNWWFSGRLRAAYSARAFMSLILLPELYGHEPSSYLMKEMDRLPT